MKLSSTAFVMIPFLLGMSSAWAESRYGELESATDPSSPASTALPTIPGEYSVPVPAALEPFSSYPLAGVCWFADGEKVGLGYALPPELTGNTDSDIKLGGVAPAGATEFKLSGDHGDADCTRKDGRVSCRVVYAKLAINPARSEEILKKSFSDPKILDARKDVSRFFQHEPVGIIEFEDRPSQFPAQE